MPAGKWSSSLRERFRGRAFFVTLAFLALIFAAVARDYAHLYALSFRPGVGIYLSFAILSALVLLPAFYSAGDLPSERCERARMGRFLIPLCLLPYLIYAAATADFRWSAFLKLLSLLVVALVVYGCFPVRQANSWTWQDSAVAVMLVASVLTGQLKGIWNVPLNLDFMSRLFLVALGAICWVFLRPVPELGYSFRLSWSILKQAGLQFVAFAVIAVPLSLGVHFTKWNPQWRGTGGFLLNYLEIFLFVALLEELFFRGFLQTLLSHALRSRLAGQLFVSGLFGLFHILHAPFPNWRYVALASVAGWFYGSAFNRAGNLMASTLTHAAVDTVWRTFLSAR